MPKATTLARQIANGAVLVATPSHVRGGPWHYTLDGVKVMIAPDQMVGVMNSPDIWVENLTGDRIRYRAMTKAEHKRFRAQYREWRKKNARTI